MNYLHDKKIKNKKIFRIASLIFLLIILFYFRSSIWGGLSMLSHTVFRPVLAIGNSVGEKLSGAKAYFVSKSSLDHQNKNLKSQLSEQEARTANYNSILAENIDLKEILNRKDPKINMTLAAILAKPHQSPYDTLIIDAGIKQGIQVNDMVFGLGNVPIGVVAETYPNSSKVVLFSNSGRKTQVVISGKNIFMELVGRGGGNFEMIIQRDLAITKGEEVVLPGIVPYVVAKVETIISDPRDPFVKALLTSPVNIQELKFVEIEIN